MYKRKPGTLWMLLGGLLICAALFLTIHNLNENKQAENSVTQISSQLQIEVDENLAERIESEEDVPDYVRYPELEMPMIEIDGESYVGFLEIPELDLSLPIMAGQWSEEKLKKSPCIYKGSVYMDDMIIAGHNYRSHFSPLKKLKEGTEIYFIDAEGNTFPYILAWTEIIEEVDVHRMVEKNEDWDLTLFTCTYGGGERYTLRCVKNMS